MNNHPVRTNIFHEKIYNLFFRIKILVLNNILLLKEHKIIYTK